MGKLRLFCDYDGVLVDFDTAACRIHKVDPKILTETRKPGEWCLKRCISLAKGLEVVMSDEAFYRPINGDGNSFWSKIKPLPWAKEMLQLLDDCDVIWWKFLTTPSHAASSYTGKISSMRKVMGDPLFHEFHITPHKVDLATPNSVLIDDRDKNIAEFIAAGGKGITFPTMGNRLHKYSADPLKYVREQLERLRCI